MSIWRIGGGFNSRNPQGEHVMASVNFMKCMGPASGSGQPVEKMLDEETTPRVAL